MKNLFKKNCVFAIESFNFNEYTRSRLSEFERTKHNITCQVDISPKNVYLSKKLDQVLMKTLVTVIANTKKENSDDDLLLFTLATDFSIELTLKKKLKNAESFTPDLIKFKSISAEKIIPEINDFLKKTQLAFIELPIDIDVEN